MKRTFNLSTLLKINIEAGHATQRTYRHYSDPDVEATKPTDRQFVEWPRQRERERGGGALSSPATLTELTSFAKWAPHLRRKMYFLC